MSVASVLKGAYAQVNPFDNGATYGTYNNGFSAKPPTTPRTSIPTPSYQTGTGIDTSGYDKQISDSNNAIKALQSQIAQQPRLPFYNVSQAWAQAQKNAESNVNPVYTDKLNAYLKKAQLSQQQQQQQTDLNKKDIGTALDQSLEDSGISRTRTNEDTQTNLDDQAATEAYSQEAGGTAFDRARSALMGDVANSGLTTSGLGQQQVANAQSDRNVQDKEEVRQFKGQQEATKTLQTRTLADLDKSDVRSKGDAASKTNREDINLKNFIDNASLDENSFRTSNEADRLAAVAGEVNNQYKIGSANFIQGLIGSGARAQDIALAQQVYG